MLLMENKKSLKESLKNYEAIINEIEDGVGETDLKGNLTFINNAGCRMWGYVREEIVGTNYQSYIDKDGAIFLRKAYNQVYKTGLQGYNPAQGTRKRTQREAPVSEYHRPKQKMQDTYRLLEDLANLETTVLVTGESGTGKELVAKALHYSGQRSFHPFVAVNCSALAESLLESELFGHVRGAFTGAIKDKQGRFEAANGGTIMLDEIGDISPLIQLKLLRVLQEKVFERVGESVPRKMDVRVIACTNKNLKEKVRRGEFREDLYYRLMIVEVALPPLRERMEDLPPLIDHFLHAFNERFQKDIEGVSQEVLNKFMLYSWPGNVRELEHTIEHAFILCRGKVITLEHLPTAIRDSIEADKIKTNGKQYAKKFTGEEKILEALDKTDGNKAKAARLLGINRRTLYRKINKKQTPPRLKPWHVTH